MMHKTWYNVAKALRIDVDKTEEQFMSVKATTTASTWTYRNDYFRIVKGHWL